jgi:hypothetical protein
MFILADQSRRVSSENRFDTYDAESAMTSGVQSEGCTSHSFYGRSWVWADLRPSASQPITKTITGRDPIMGAAIEVSVPCSEIEREIRNLESLLTQNAMEAGILHEKLDILRTDPMSQRSRCR